MKRLLAAFIFFTRLPFWRIASVPTECFKHVVPYWPVAGWLTGGILAGTLWLFAQVLPLQVAWIGAIIVRLLITGCLHEDGLADFLRRLRRRNHPRADACHYEGFAHRHVWRGGTDCLLPALVANGGVFPSCYLVRCGFLCGCLYQMVCVPHSQPLALHPQGRREQSKNNLQSHDRNGSFYGYSGRRNSLGVSAPCRIGLGLPLSACLIPFALRMDEAAYWWLYRRLLRSGIPAL